MREKYLESIRKACVAANPEISMCQRCEKSPPIQSDFCGDGLAHIIQNRPIRLADMLLAIGDTGYSNALLSAMIHKDGTFGILGVVWDLFKDLDGQSDPTVKFIASLLTGDTV